MSLLTLPDKEPSETPLDKLQNWKLVEGLRADFWSKWSRTYLNTLQQRHKWQRRRASINVGDIVLIVDPSLLLPCGRWPLGRVTHTYPGSDGQVRVAQVQTASGSYKRPVVKLVSLPVRTNPPDPASPIPAHGGRAKEQVAIQFTLGLRANLQAFVQAERPQTLDNAIALAIKFENLDSTRRPLDESHYNKSPAEQWHDSQTENASTSTDTYVIMIL
ncbi:unnamed protein product [Trichogramma brassicae]|uniref:DUF5641 domain-containing protein n=1 Tax=Trichogramma brassicae TaxID=86971 RepID=A0A6H5J4R3_9HYME|nr:unnamed protein product [Trichogramma brassicae]